MLFDLRGRGRRRTVQAIYLTLAILMGGGLVLFGIGGATNGGLVDAISGNNSTQSTSDVFKDRIKSAEKRTQANPRDVKAWAELARARYQQAGTGGNYDQNTGAFTDKGKKELAGVEQAWNRYMSLDPQPPDDTVAALMVQAFGPAGLGKLDKAVTAQEIVTEERDPSSGLFAQLSVLAYEAGQLRKGDLARKKALELVPKDDREALKAQLDSAKQGATSKALKEAGATTGG